MVDINLTCRLNKKARTFTVKVNTGNDVDFLKEKIKQKFSCDDARDIKLWKLDREDDNLDLILVENKTELTEGSLNRFWEAQSLNANTHVIVDSPHLILKQETDQRIKELESTERNVTLHDLCESRCIEINYMLEYRRNIKVPVVRSIRRRCKVINVTLGGEKYFIEVEINNERRLIHELAELSRWVLDIEVNGQASNNNPHKYFMIIHVDGEELGTAYDYYRYSNDIDIV